MTKNKKSLSQLKSMTKELGYDPRIDVYPAGSRIGLRDPNSPFVIILDVPNDKNIAFTYVYVRTTSWDFEGERTDLHDAFSMLLAIFLRACFRKVSCTLWDIRNPAVEEMHMEIYARYLTISQPSESIFEITPSGLEQLKAFLAAIGLFQLLLPELLEWISEESNQISTPDFGFEEAEGWATSVSRIINEHIDSEYITFNWRLNPNWHYFRSVTSNLSIYKAPKLVQELQKIESQLATWKKVDGIKGLIFLDDDLGNCVSYRDINFARRLINKLNKKKPNDGFAILPIENYFVAAGGAYVIFFKRDCGKKKFEEEKERVWKRHQTESQLLFPIALFEWSEVINDEEFELFMLDLLKHEKGVNWIRKVSPSTERDGGRDLIAEWSTPPVAGQVLIEEQPLFITRKVIIQCKASKGSLGKSKVQDIRDTVDHYNAQGYFLTVSSQLTTTLTDHLERLRSEGRFWVDWWTRSEIEDRLKARLDIVAKYPNIVKRKA